MSNMLIAGVALLYQKDCAHKIKQKVRCILVDLEDNDDEYSLRAKAERYIANDEELYNDLKEYKLIAWSMSLQSNEEIE